MEETRTTRKSDSLEELREQRQAAATVAAYIHEVSDRHAAARSEPRASYVEEDQ